MRDTRPMPARSQTASEVSRLLEEEIRAQAGAGPEPAALYAIARQRHGLVLEPKSLLPGSVSIPAAVHAAAARETAAAAVHGRHPEYVGAAVRFHAWMLPWEALKGGGGRRAAEDARVGPGGQRGDCIAAHYAMAVTRDGGICQALQFINESCVRSVDMPAGTSPLAGPAIGGALRSLTVALTGITLPDAGWAPAVSPAGHDNDYPPSLE